MKLSVLVATRNRHKLSEFGSLVSRQISWLNLDQFPGTPVVEETASTFEGNAKLKAEAIAAWLCKNPSLLHPYFDSRDSAARFLVMADDSGLEVDCLGGAPGVHSARFAAMDRSGSGNSADAENNAKLLGLLSGMPGAKHTARFRCVIAATEITQRTGSFFPLASVVFSGSCEGSILAESRGAGGFGYDPLFQPLGMAQTFSELGETAKNRISHRAMACQAFEQWLAG